MRLLVRPGLFGLLVSATLLAVAPVALAASPTAEVSGKAVSSPLGVKSSRTSVKPRVSATSARLRASPE